MTQKPNKYIAKDCSLCGGAGKSVNPDWIRWRRLEMALSLREVAREIGISAQYLCDIEKGRRNCPMKVSDFLGRA